MGQIAHLRKTVQIIIIMLIKRRKKTLLISWEVNGSSFEQTWIPFTQGCIVPKFGWNWPSDSREDFFNFVNASLLFRNYLPLEKGGPFNWKKLNPLHPRILCTKFGWNWPSGSGARRRWKCEKFTTTPTKTTTTDNGYILIQKSSLEPVAQVS